MVAIVGACTGQADTPTRPVVVANISSNGQENMRKKRPKKEMESRTALVGGPALPVRGVIAKGV